jgi:putative endonuclease
MNKGYMYILECADGSYYTGSTKDLERRLAQHQAGEGANHTKKRLPVKLVYYEEFQRIDDAFYREKQVQGWSRKKKEALMNGVTDELKILAECMNESHYKNRASASLSPQNMGTVEQEKKVVEQEKKVVEQEKKVVEQEKKVVEQEKKVVERSRNHRDDNLKGLRYE